jgi:phosphate transport system substrate-binding protein
MTRQLSSGVRTAPRLAGAAMLLLASSLGWGAMAEPIRGAGSTFAAPIIAKWAKIYQDARTDGGSYVSPDWTVDYERVGSLGGLMRLHQPELDFAASDVPVTPDELGRRGYRQFPIVMGAIAIVTNLDGLPPDGLRLSGPVLADIFLGKIQSWSDPAIRSLNPQVELPDLPIVAIHRQDGSGSTFVLTEYLSAASEEWKAKYGADMLVAWPLGRSVKGTQDLLQAVRTIKGAISYAEYGQAARASLPSALILNKAGRFAKPDPEGVRAAADAIDWTQTKHFHASLTDRAGEKAYPITTATFVIVPVSQLSPERIRRVEDLFRLAFAQGREDATALGYVPLPASLVAEVERSWADDNQTTSGNHAAH